MATKLKIESGVQLLARLTKRPSIEKFYPPLFQTGPINGDVIEILSDTCTSQFLTNIISELLCHTQSNEEPAEVLIINTDGNINYDELISATEKKISYTVSSSQRYANSADIKKELYKTMARLHISNVYDASQFYTTIYNLENTLVEHPKIAMIIFDTLTAFYWSEQGFKITKMDLYTKNLLSTIQKVTKEYKIICMYTKPEYFCTNKEAESLHTVNFQIQLLDNDNGNYQVNIKTLLTKFTKFFSIIEGNLKWLS